MSEIKLMSITIRVAGLMTDEDVTGLKDLIAGYLQKVNPSTAEVGNVDTVLVMLDALASLSEAWALEPGQVEEAVTRCIEANPWIDGVSALSDLVSKGAYFDLPTGKLLMMGDETTAPQPPSIEQ